MIQSGREKAAAFIVDSQVCDDKGHGIRRQCQHIGAFCAAYDLTLTKWYRFDCLDTDFPVLRELGDDVNNGTINIIIVGHWKTIIEAVFNSLETYRQSGQCNDNNIDELYQRCFRDRKNVSQDFIHSYLFNDAHMISASDYVESQTIVGSMMRAVLTAHRHISSATSMATARQLTPQDEQKKHAGTVPYGYVINTQSGGGIYIDERAADAIRYIFSLHREGHSLSYIANYMNQMGFRTAMGERFLPKQIARVIKRQNLYEGLEYQTRGRWGDRTVSYPQILPTQENENVGERG